MIDSPETLIDVTALRSQLQALSAQHGRSSPALRPAVVQELKAVLQAARTEAETRLLEDGDGTACAENLSYVEDELIRALFDLAARTLFPPEASGGNEPIAIVAVGGYGRGTLAPGSDIDLLFVLPAAPDRRGSRASSSSSSTTLWDTRQKVGHATRNIDECIRLAKTDNTILTAILEARYICGDVSALRAPGA